MGRSRTLRRASVWAALALLALPALAGGKARRAPYVIGVEDVLHVAMPDHPELSSTVPVRPDGRISLPLVDDVEAAGRTPAELKAGLQRAYEGFLTVPNISVIVQEIHSLKIYVLGEVGQPGVFEVRRPVRVLQAIALAGGFTEFAGKDRVILLREGEAGQERIEIRLKPVYSGEDLSPNRLLRSGDTLVIP